MCIQKCLSRFFLTLILCICLGYTALANSVKHCDSLIRSGVEAMQRNEHVKSLELLTQARALAEKNHWYEQQFLAINNIGNNYHALLEYGEALNFYLDAYTIALKQLGPKFEMIVLNNIAILYSKEKKYDKAREYFSKAYTLAAENKDEFKMGLYAMNLGNVANEVNDPELARNYYTESLPLLKSQPDFLVMAKIGLIDSDLAEGHTEKARIAAEKLLKVKKDLETNNGEIALLTIMAKAYLKENNLKQSENYVFTAFRTQPDLEAKITLFELLSEVYFKGKSYAKALQYKDSIIKANNEIDAVKNGKLYENSKVKFEIQNYRNELALKEAKIANERKVFYSVLAIVIIIVFFIVWTFRNLSVKHKQKKLIAERNEQILSLELEKEKSEHLLLEKQLEEKETVALLEQERLKNELEQRNRKLSAKALYLSGRNQMIEEVLSELSELPQLSNKDALSGHIKTLKDQLKSDNEWDDFITHFEEVNHTFLHTLKTKHPALTVNDIRFISYIYMNLSTKEIASMLNITAEACRKRKERISSKMELPEEIKLYDYLASL